MRRILGIILLAIILLILGAAGYFFWGSAKPAENISWGIVFSQKHAQLLGLDWQETYLALLDELGVKKIKVASYWDLIEKEGGEYDFNDLDWQIHEAAKRNAKILLVIGLKTPRWPECHVPDWDKNSNMETQQGHILNLLEEIILRYKESPVIWAWQVENEPAFPFGICPWTDEEFLKKEINLVKSLDAQRPVIISDSGEFSLWTTAANYGDVVGVTMYRKVWFHQLAQYLTYPFPPVFYQRKALIVQKLFGKEVIVVELQAEPWGPKLLYDVSPEEQKKTMDLEQFMANINFARNSGLREFYLWGAEWWYWMKEKQNEPQIWNEAKKLF
ncbi:MAG: beta-galactosidase [Candidatus Nealsonbacteria bacterium]|nr:beta-galactosidase [Candidatus Nealsonbacteria bacterium]